MLIVEEWSSRKEIMAKRIKAVRMVWLSLVLLGVGGLILIFSNKPVVQDTPILVQETNAAVETEEIPVPTAIVQVVEEVSATEKALRSVGLTTSNSVSFSVK